MHLMTNNYSSALTKGQSIQGPLITDGQNCNEMWLPLAFLNLNDMGQAYSRSGPFTAIPSICNQRSLDIHNYNDFITFE